MRTFLAGILITLVVLMALLQLALPSYLAGRVEGRLERGGGEAEVSLGAIPAILLLGGRGSSFEAHGSGLRFDLGDRRESPFDRLDGFARVDMDLTDLDAGPLKVERFSLSRTGRDTPYQVTVQASITPRELASGLGSAAGGSLGGLLGALATGMLSAASRTEIPLKLESTVSSENGKAKVRDARGSVAGVPAGPLAEVVLGAVLDRL